LNGVA